MNPKQIPIREYSYSLPEERIAKYPLAERGDSKLLIYQKGGSIQESRYNHIAEQIPEGTLLVFNNTKVVEARLQFQKPTGGVIEIFCLEPHPKYADITSAMMQTGSVQWQCLIGGASKWKPGQILEKSIAWDEQTIRLRAQYIEKKTDVFIIELQWEPAGLSFAETLHLFGAIPLPPYIKRAAEEQDKDRYQTVYAKTAGSVAAPTAGLHFTQGILESLRNKNIGEGYVTLHVGAGTFKPVKSETIGEHEMHAEWIDVTASFIQQLITQQGRPVIAVGTTSLRTIESLYWLGVKAAGGTMDANAGLTQWECYDLAEKAPSVKTALEALLHWLNKQGADRLITRTQIIIAPGYTLKVADALITNFHQPQSTLLLLIAAVIGDDWKKVYDHALQHDFRFLSYGDGSLLWRRD